MIKVKLIRSERVGHSIDVGLWRRPLFTLFVYLFIWGTTGPVEAQQSLASIQAKPTIEEIYVVARKREEAIGDIPVAATVVTESELRKQSVQDLFDIQFQVPNLQIAPFPAVNGDAGVSIRGQSQFEPVITLDPAVGIYLDGVYLGRATGALLNLVDLERVEVLMGPQGTIYGRNTTGGVINQISNRNHDSDFGGYIDVVGGNFSQRNVTAALNFPLLKDSLSARLSYRNANHDGYGVNTLLGEDLDDESARYLRANLSWKPNQNTDLFISYDDTRHREHSALFRINHVEPSIQDVSCLNQSAASLGCFVNFVVAGGELPNALNGNPREIRSDVSSTHDLDVSGIAGTVLIEFGGVSFKSISAYRELNRRNINDIDGTEWEILHPDADAYQQQVSQEFQLEGEAFGDRLNWLGGVFYFDEEGNDNTSVIGVPQVNPFSPSVILPKGENSSYAAYGHLIYSHTPKLNITAGLRYTREKRKLSSQQFNAAGCSLEFTNEPDCRTTVSERFSDWSYTAGLDYRWHEGLMTYVSVSRGFKSGGFNARAVKEVEFQPFNPEIVDNFELGMKSNWPALSTQLNLSFFYSDYDNIQRAQLIALSSTDIATSVSNAASAYITGGELQLMSKLLEGAEFSASAGLTVAKYDEFFDTDREGNILDKSNLEFPNAPRWNYSVGLKYTPPKFRNLSFRAEYSRTDKIYHDVNNSELIAQDDRGLLNLRIDVTIPKRHIDLAFFVKNLTNELYVTGGLDFTDQFGYSGTFLGPPRTIHAQATWHFGRGRD